METCLRTCSPSQDSDQPAHSRSLIRIFTGKIATGAKFLHADAQADLTLRWAHMSEGNISHVTSSYHHENMPI